MFRFQFSLDCIPSNARQECVSTTLKICLFQVSAVRTVKFVWAQICADDVHVSHWVGSTISVKTLVQRSPGLPDLFHRLCQVLNTLLVCIVTFGRFTCTCQSLVLHERLSTTLEICQWLPNLPTSLIHLCLFF